MDRLNPSMVTNTEGETSEVRELDIPEQRLLLDLIERASDTQRLLLVSSMVVIGYVTIDEIEQMGRELHLMAILQRVFGTL